MSSRHSFAIIYTGKNFLSSQVGRNMFMLYGVFFLAFVCVVLKRRDHVCTTREVPVEHGHV